ncbi:hypothetical protein SEA_NANOSMITE_156 [Mycobacterium phage Nanosmite]|nr:hypothetical protein SEA_NANOSMITE_156 [Mycobacterium phage Nanosmite]
MWAVWMKDAIDDDRSVLSDLTAGQADRLVNNLKNILPDAQVWMEEE